MPVVKIPEWYAYLFRLKTETAAMARPSDQSTKVIREKSVAVMDCGASQTIISSLIYCKDVVEKMTIIETYLPMYAPKRILWEIEWGIWLQSP